MDRNGEEGEGSDNPRFNGFGEAESQVRSDEQNSENFQELKKQSMWENNNNMQNLVIHAHSENIIPEEEQSNSHHKSSSNHNDCHDSDHCESDGYLRVHQHKHNIQILNESRHRLSEHFREEHDDNEDSTPKHRFDFGNGSFQIQRITNTFSIEEEIKRSDSREEVIRHQQTVYHEITETEQNIEEQPHSSEQGNAQTPHKEGMNSEPFINENIETGNKTNQDQQLSSSYPEAQQRAHQKPRIQAIKFQPTTSIVRKEKHVVKEVIENLSPRQNRNQQTPAHNLQQLQTPNSQKNFHPIVSPVHQLNTPKMQIQSNMMMQSPSQNNISSRQNIGFHSPVTQFPIMRNNNPPMPPQSIQESFDRQQRQIYENRESREINQPSFRNSYQVRSPNGQNQRPSFRVNSPQDIPMSMRNSRLLQKNKEQLNRRSVSFHSSQDRKSVSGTKPQVRFTYVSNYIEKTETNQKSPSFHSPPSTQFISYPSPRGVPPPAPMLPKIQVIEQKNIQQTNWQKLYFDLSKQYRHLFEDFHSLKSLLDEINSQIDSPGAQLKNVVQLSKKVTKRVFKIEQTYKSTYQSTKIFRKFENIELCQNRQLEEMVETLKKQLEEIKNENIQIKKLNQQLDKKVGKYSVEYAVLDREYHQLEHILRNSDRSHEISTLKDQLKQIQENKHKEITEILQVNENMKQQILQLSRIKQNQQEEIQSLHHQLSEIKVTSEMVQEQKLAEHQEILQSLKTTIQNLEINNAELLQSNNSFKTSNQKLQQIIASQKTQINGLEDNILRITRELNEKNVVRNELCEEKFKENLRNLQDKLNMRDKQINDYINQLDELRREKERGMISSNNASLNLQILKQENTNLQYNNKILLDKQKGLLEEISNLKTQNSEIQRRIELRMSEKITSLERQLSAKSSEIPNKRSIREKQDEVIEEYEKQIDKLKADIRTKQQEKRKLEDDVFAIEEKTRRMMMEKQSEVRLLNDKLKVTQDELQRKIKDKDRKISNLEEQIEMVKKTARKSITPKQIPQIPAPSNQHEIKMLKQRYNILQDQCKELAHLKQERQKKIAANNQVIVSLQEQLSKSKQQVLNLKRQSASITSLENEVKILTESLNKKSNQLLNLKSISFQYNQLQVELQTLKKQRTNLRQMLKIRGKEIEQLHNVNHELQMERSTNKDILSRSYNKPMLVLSNKNMDDSDDYQIMGESVRRKNDQIFKLKQTNQLKATNIEELEYQVQKLRNKLSNAERSLNHEKQEAEEREQQLESRNKQLELKLKTLDESQKNAKITYEQEIQNLEIAIKEKEQIIRRHEGQIKVHKIKLKGHDNKVQEYQQGIQALNEKIKELQSEKSQMKKQINDLESSGKLDKNKLYDDYQLKIAELETAATVKDKKIKFLENNVETLKLRISVEENPKKEEEEFVNQQQIEVLKKKVAEYESRMLQKNLNLGMDQYFKSRDFASGFVFQQKIIYELKSENERLKMLLGQRSQKKIINPTGSIQTQANINELQDRLLDFNEKLQNMIKANQELEQFHHVSQQNFRKSGYRDTRIQRDFSRKQQILLKRHQDQIKQMQAWMVELHRYCASMEEGRGINSNTNKQSYGRNIIIQDKQHGNQQLKYYREKSKEYEQMINNHIQLNRELKLKLEEYLKGSPDSNIVFYKEQLSRYEKQLTEYEDKIRKLNERNNSLQRDLNKIESDQSAEMRIMDLENVIQETNRKIASLQMQVELLTRDYNKSELELQKANKKIIQEQAEGQEKARKIANLEKNAHKSSEEFQEKLKKSANKLLILQSEVERLNQLIEKDSSGHTEQVTKQNAKITQLLYTIQTLQNENSQYKEQIQKYEDSGSQFNSFVKHTNTEIQKLNNVINMQTNKFKDYQRKIDEMEDELQSIRKQNLMLIRDKDEMQVTYDDTYFKYTQVSRAYKQKCAELEQNEELLLSLRGERQKQGDQSKKKLAYISEMQNTIDRLKKQLIYYKEVHQSAQDEITSLQIEITRLETEINRLRSIILEIQQQIMGYDGLKSNLKFSLEYLRSNLLVIQSLAEEMASKSNSSQTTTMMKLRESIQKGLQNCSEAFTIIQ